MVAKIDEKRKWGYVVTFFINERRKKKKMKKERKEGKDNGSKITWFH